MSYCQKLIERITGKTMNLLFFAFSLGWANCLKYPVINGSKKKHNK